MIRQRHAICVVVGALSWAALVHAQGAATFDVASIKPAAPAKTAGPIRFGPGNTFTAAGVTLADLMQAAYRLQPDQVDGGADWAKAARFDVIAKSPSVVPPTRAMLQRLLAERFSLVTHVETRELPFLALETAADRRLGPKLQPSTVDCDAVSRAPRPSPSDARQECDDFVGAPPRFLAAGVTMAQVAASLSRVVNKIVVDRTGLNGRFDLDLTWTPADLPDPKRQNGAESQVRLNGVTIDRNGPTIAIALQEQLGLKLTERRGAVDVRVIDRANRPSPD
jgi:uncharacterized protein (TIGR03435 family)